MRLPASTLMLMRAMRELSSVSGSDRKMTSRRLGEASTSSSAFAASRSPDPAEDALGALGALGAFPGLSLTIFIYPPASLDFRRAVRGQRPR